MTAVWFSQATYLTKFAFEFNDTIFAPPVGSYELDPDTGFVLE